MDLLKNLKYQGNQFSINKCYSIGLFYGHNIDGISCAWHQWNTAPLYFCRQISMLMIHCDWWNMDNKFSDIIMSAIASQIPRFTTVYSTVYSGADQRKCKRFASLAFVRGIPRWPLNFRTKGQWPGKCFHLMKSWGENNISPTMVPLKQATSCIKLSS